MSLSRIASLPLAFFLLFDLINTEGQSSAPSAASVLPPPVAVAAGPGLAAGLASPSAVVAAKLATNPSTPNAAVATGGFAAVNGVSPTVKKIGNITQATYKNIPAPGNPVTVKILATGTVSSGGTVTSQISTAQGTYTFKQLVAPSNPYSGVMVGGHGL